MLRRCQSYRGKSQLPSYEGVMAEFTGWLGLQRSGQLHLTCNMQGTFSFRWGPVQACLEDFHTGSYNKASWSGKKCQSKFSRKTFNMIFSAFLYFASRKPCFYKSSGELKSLADVPDLRILWDFKSNSYNSFQDIPSVVLFSLSVPFLKHMIQLNPTAHRKKKSQPCSSPCFQQHLPQKPGRRGYPHYTQHTKTHWQT